MGHAILYCASCSMQLREPDFEKGLAFRAEGRAFCKKCAPEEVRARAPVVERKPDLISSTRISVVPPPVASGSGRTTVPLVVGGVALVVGLLAAVFWLNGTPPRAPSPPADPEVSRPREAAPIPTPDPLPTPAPPPPPKDERPA